MAITRKTLKLSDQLKIFLSGVEHSLVRDLVEAWARAWGQVEGEWLAAIGDLVANSNDGKWPTRRMIARAERAQQVIQITYEEILALADFAGVRVVTSAREVTDQTAFWQARLIASQMPKEAGTQAELIATLSRVDASAIRAIVERTTDQITSAMNPIPDMALEEIKRALIRGVVVGDNPKTVARKMVRRVESSFNLSLTRALVIARTEMLDAHRSAGAANHFDHSDVLAGWIWLAKLDTRTCPSCWVQHGRLHRLEEVGPEDHHQGRCARLPKVRSWAELGFEDIEEPEDLLADARAVFDELPEADRLAVMGSVRLAALDAGEIPWSALSKKIETDGWRDSYITAPINDLRRRMLRSAG